MCGILGSYGRPFSEEFVARFNGALALLKHRGPDGTRVWSREDVILGHTRLSIVDLSELSGQPMADRSERYWIVLNGEIYNYLELRKELEGYGAGFRTHSDTEVVLEAFKTWGPGCLERFNGMWAFAIFDTAKGELFLSRDRYGVKPLFYAESGGHLHFGSEMKALLALGVDSEPNWAQIARVAREWGCDADGDTPFKNILMLAPGHYMLISPEKQQVVKWWDIVDRRVEVPKTFDERVEVFRDLFEDAVRLRLRNDVDTGVSLSGGMDSSSVYGAARKLQKMDAAKSATSGQAKMFRIYSVSYPGNPFDEFPWVEKCLGFWNDHDHVSRVYPKPEMFPEMIDEVIWHQEAPVWSPMVFAFHCLYRHIASLGTRVVLEGHGSDELLGGYAELVSAAIQTYAMQNNVRMTWKAAQCYADTLNPLLNQSQPEAWKIFLIAFPLSRRLLKFAVQPLRALERHSSLDPHPGIKGYIHPNIVNLCPPLASQPVDSFGILNRELYTSFTQRPLPTVLRIVDRASMDYSLEVRAPFMDYRIVQYAFSLPDGDKIARRTKEILRHAAGEWVPEEVIDRKAKMPFSLAERTWFNSPVVGKYLADIFHSSDAMNSNLIDGKALVHDLDGFSKQGFGRYDTNRVWMALNLYLWNKALVNPFRS
jgi:asparagine synthase (glutamine-hydrolysing)